MSSSTLPQAWETALDPGLVKRLSPLRSRVIDPKLSQQLYARLQFLSDRLSLFHQLSDRYLNAAEWQTEALPIVYAQPRVSDPVQGSGVASGTQSSRDRAAASSASESSSIVVQAKFSSAQSTPKNPSHSDMPAASPLPIVRGTAGGIAGGIAGGTVQNPESPTAPLQATAHPSVILQTTINPAGESYSQPDLIQVDPIQNALERTTALIGSQSHLTSTAHPPVIASHYHLQAIAPLPFQREVSLPSEMKTIESPLPQVHPIRSQMNAIAELPLQTDLLPNQPVAINKPALLPQVHPIQAPLIQTLEAPSLPLQSAAIAPSFVFVQPSVPSASPVESSTALNPVEIASGREQRSSFHTEITPSQETRPPHSTADPPISEVQSPPAINIDALVDTVERKLMRRLIIEQERRG
ncbi:hypothetical protein H6F89_23855 [Cyanobacteria bacterium FACHB-63]|nr:hypothetical protein [Cyanobacteria bacterium FACHB-63]